MIPPLLHDLQLTKATASLLIIGGIPERHMSHPLFPRSCHGGKYAWRVPGSETRIYAPEASGSSARRLRCDCSARGSGLARRATESGPERRVCTPWTCCSGALPSYLLVTGGVGKYPPAEAEVMQRLAVAHGIPPRAHSVRGSGHLDPGRVPCGVVTYYGSAGGHVCWW